MVNNRSTEITPPQNVKAIHRARVCASKLRKDARQIGIRFFSCATDDLLLTFKHDVCKVFHVELPGRSGDFGPELLPKTDRSGVCGNHEIELHGAKAQPAGFVQAMLGIAQPIPYPRALAET